MTDKKELRALYKSVRQSISENDKQVYDKAIFTRLVNSFVYNSSETVLIYVSFGSEVDTNDIIKYSLECGKTVAVPYCRENEMLFYTISSIDELVKGKYGIPTVDTENKLPHKDFENALCVVPALSFDLSGNRLGYGGGYYDRFLALYNINSLGLSYGRCISNQLPAESFDVKVKYIVTENFLKKL